MPSTNTTSASTKNMANASPTQSALRASQDQELRNAKLDEIALERHLHRMRDPERLGTLRKLRAKIASLEARLDLPERD